MLLGARAVWLNEPKASAEGFPVSSQQRVFSLESVQDFLYASKGFLIASYASLAILRIAL